MKTLIICPIREEFNAIKSLLTSIRYYKGQYTNKRYLSGRYGNRRVILLCSGRGETAVGNAVHTAIKDFNFSYVFLVGTAGGIKKVRIGDVVIASAAYQYESGREVNGAFHSIPKILNSDEQLLQLAMEQNDPIRSKIVDTANQEVRVFFKPIASGAKIIESKEGQIFKILQERYNDAIALEMEAYAFQAAVRNYSQVQSLNIRGISDLLSDKRSANAKGSKEIATRHAALFALTLIQRLPASKVLWKRSLLPVAATVALVFAFLLWSNFSNRPEPSSEVLNEIVDTSTTKDQPPVLLAEIIPEAPKRQKIQELSTSDQNNEIKKVLTQTTTRSRIPKDSIAPFLVDTSLLINTIFEDEKKPTQPTVPKENVLLEEPPIMRYVNRCYIGVTDKGQKVSNVFVFINDKEVQTANHHLRLPVGWHWMRLEKDGMYYRERIEVRENSRLKPTFHVKWEEFTPKPYQLPTDAETSTKISQGNK